MEYDILPPTNDWVFKLLFGDKRNKAILVAFLKSFAGLPQEEYDIVFLDTNLKPEAEDEKLGILDIKIKTKTGKIIDIEIQVSSIPNIGKRLSFYKSKLIVEQIAQGDQYKIIQQVICICITDYKLFDTDDYLNTFRFYNPKNNFCFEDIPEEIITLELPKVPKSSDGAAIWDWAQFLRARRKEEFEVIAEKNPEVRKAVNTLYSLSADSTVRAEYERRLKAEMDFANFQDAAFENGKAAGRQEIIGLLESGRSLKDILQLLSHGSS